MKGVSGESQEYPEAVQLTTYIRRSLFHHWRANLAVVLGVMAATATLTGALLVGDSMRGSLRDRALRRLGPVDHALVAQRFVRESLAANISKAPHFSEHFRDACPVILMRGGISHATTQSRANGIRILGVDDRFWNLSGKDAEHLPAKNAGQPTIPAKPTERTVVLNTLLAKDLGAEVGDDVLIRLEKRSLVPIETLLGHSDDATLALRLTVRDVVPMDGLGGFGVRPDKRQARNAFIPLATLQRAIDRQGRINTILVARIQPSPTKTGSVEEGKSLQPQLPSMLHANVTLADFDLHIRRDVQNHCISLETDRLLIEPAVEDAAAKIAEAMKAPAAPLLTYLVNSIRLCRADGDAPTSADPDAPTIPYSTATAIDIDIAAFPQAFKLNMGSVISPLGPREILLNTWAANDLGVAIGDKVELTYFVSRPFGQLEEQTTDFAVRGVVEMSGWGADTHLTPSYKGITDTDHLSDWDPPFPIHMDRLRDRDEAYWDEYRATPKAFISLDAGRELWATSGERFGHLTAIRFSPVAGQDVEDMSRVFEQALLKKINPADLGLAFEPVRRQALSAGHGSTDFGLMFIGFSFFLIVSAAVLVALMFRLNVEQRAREIGMLLAMGYSPKKIACILLSEGAILATTGTLLGLIASLGYAWLMLAGLRSLWAAAVNAPFLQLHVSALSITIGVASSLLVALVALAWALRGLSRMPPRALLSGIVQSGRVAVPERPHKRAIILMIVALFATIAMVIFALTGGAASQAGGFFCGGFACLFACGAGLSMWIGKTHRPLIHMSGIGAMIRLGVRNAIRNRGRSLLTFSLIASAAFVIVAVGANRKRSRHIEDSRYTPTGGFSLMAEASVPLRHDLNTPEGIDALVLSDDTIRLMEKGTVIPFRLKAGDDASCLNIYQIQRPRILGATPTAIDWGGFSFAATMAITGKDNKDQGGDEHGLENPWRLLRAHFDDGAVPAIADYGTVIWLLHLGLGHDFDIVDEGGRTVKLRFVALTKGSILQGQLIVAEDRFVEMFPSVNGYAFHLISSQPATTVPLAHALERDLATYGFDVDRTTDRLEEYMAVENTYLSTFQTLGGLGLLLGTLGLTAVMLRNIHERRGELALLRSLGYRPALLAWMILSENGIILIVGLAAGTLSAMLAIVPHITSSASAVPWVSLGGTLLSIFAVGMLTGTIALATALRAPLLPSLRRE